MLTSLDEAESQTFFSRLRIKFLEVECWEITLGHTQCAWTTQSVWLSDSGWPAGHPGKDGGNCLWSLVGGLHRHSLVWRIVCLLEATLSCSHLHCLVRGHQWPSFTALQPRPILQLTVSPPSYAPPKQQIWLRTALCGGWCWRMALRNRELHATNDDDNATGYSAM